MVNDLEQKPFWWGERDCDAKGLHMRVLLIEDEPTTAKAIELMLTTEGFNVYTTDLGEEGLDLGKLYDYDIICLDLNLPDMHGYDVLKKLRAAKEAAKEAREQRTNQWLNQKKGLKGAPLLKKTFEHMEKEAGSS